MLVCWFSNISFCKTLLCVAGRFCDGCCVATNRPSRGQSDGRSCSSMKSTLFDVKDVKGFKDLVC